MDNFIKNTLGVKDSYLKLNKNSAYDFIEENNNCVIVHMLQTYSIKGTNNKIKIIKRTAYGFRNFSNFRIRILL